MSSERGFAMADAIVALLIMSTLLTAMLEINGASLITSKKADTRLTATLIAQALLEDKSVREDTGAFEIDHRTYEWSRTREPRSLREGDSVVADDIKITVTWQDNKSQNQVSLTTSRWRVVGHER